jgi:hypothetical protein
LLEETIGNKFLVVNYIQQQSKPMGLYGLGVIILVDNLEIMSSEVIDLLQSPLLLGETIGNRLLVDILTP